MTKSNTTETTKTNSNGYPFATQKDIVNQLATDSAFRLECLEILCRRQTTDELEEKATKYTNKRGLRCSESVWMPELLANLKNDPEAVTGEALSRLATTLPKYRKQLAAHFRNEQLNNDPSLATQAAKFGL